MQKCLRKFVMSVKMIKLLDGRLDCLKDKSIL